jgi:hypothetical protein
VKILSFNKKDNYKLSGENSTIQDKINEWSTQMEQAKEYGLYFDLETVNEMLNTIQYQKKEIQNMKAELRIIDLFGWK